MQNTFMKEYERQKLNEGLKEAKWSRY